MSYDAFIDETESGYQCESWVGKPTDKWGSPKDGTTNHNYCRSTQDVDKGAWCWSSRTDRTWEYCKCAESYTGSWLGDFTDQSENADMFSVSDDTTDTRDHDCPSDKCWIYNSSEKKCEITSDCSTLTCSGKTMTININIDAFGTSASAAGISPTPIENDHGELVITCELGKCGMNYYTENERLVLSFIFCLYCNN